LFRYCDAALELVTIYLQHYPTKYVMVGNPQNGSYM